MADYFPSELICEEKLDPSENYLFVIHPHGIFCLGYWTNIANNSRNILDKLGFCFNLATVPILLKIPF